MRRVLARHLWVIGTLLLAGSASATVVTTPPCLMCEDFAGFTSNTLFGWYADSNIVGLTSTASANLNGAHGSLIGDGTYLEIKDTGTKGSWVSAGTAFGVYGATGGVDYTKFNNSTFTFQEAELSSKLSTASTFGNMTITFLANSTICATVGSANCWTNPNTNALQLTVWHNFGSPTATNQFFVVSTTFDPTHWQIEQYNPTTSTGTQTTTTLTGTQWASLITAVQNQTIDTSLQSANSSDLVAIDEWGFDSPEPKSTLALALALSTGLLVFRLKQKRSRS